MGYRKLIENLTPEVYGQLKRALELSKWPDGKLMTAEQKAVVMEAVIGWEFHHVAPELRTGYIDRGHKAEGETCDDEQVLQLDDTPPQRQQE
jgi:hypothetical protein